MTSMHLVRFILFIVLATALVNAPMRSAFAQDNKSSDAKPAAKKSSGQKKSTTIDFEDQLVEGAAAKPELFYLMQKRQFNYKRLIRLRDDFVPEMRKTAEDVERKGSGN
jgi:hypothetical protein